MNDLIGCLVEFIDKNKIILGIIQENKNGYLQVLTVYNYQVMLDKNRILFISLKGIILDNYSTNIIDYLKKEDLRRDSLVSKINIQELWELVHEEKKSLSLIDLAELVFTKPIKSEEVSALLRGLFSERIHFRLNGKKFQALTREQLKQKIFKYERQEIDQMQVDISVNFLNNLPSQGPYISLLPETIKLLSDLVIFNDGASQSKKAKIIMSLTGLASKKQIFDLLVRLGIYSSYQNLEILRDRLSLDFSSEVLVESLNLKSLKYFESSYEDLTGLHIFTIDGLYTTDFDDALSFKADNYGGGEVGIHITNVSALLPIGGALDREAMERASSLYLPDTRISMFPSVISEGNLSLRKGVKRLAISCLVQLNSEGEVVKFRIFRSLIQVSCRLTYDEADIMLKDNESSLYKLNQLMQACKHQRFLAGAYFLSLPEVIINVDYNWQVLVKRVDQEGLSRNMVAETAILANWLIARFLVDKGVPALFRAQSNSREFIEENSLSDLYLKFKQRRLLNRVQISTIPGRHSMLGVEYYVHATSPIRRYLDLLVQRQLSATLANLKLPYNAEELKRILHIVKSNIHRGVRIRQARQRYWLLKWLETQIGLHLPAIIIEYQHKHLQILLTDIMLLTTIPTNDSYKKLFPGERIMVKIIKVDAFYNILKLILI